MILIEYTVHFMDVISLFAVTRLPILSKDLILRFETLIRIFLQHYHPLSV